MATNVPPAAPVQAAVGNINQGLKANTSLINATRQANAGMNVSKNVGVMNTAANKTAANYAAAAKNLRKANMNRAANSFENAAKKAHVGDGVGAAKSAGAGLRAMLKTNNAKM